MAYTITDACKGCTLCAKNCPVNAISGELKEKHEINPDVCISCGLCSKLCNMNAILDDEGNPTQKVKKEDWKHPEVNRGVCAGCSVCIRNCPKNCLELTKPKRKGDIRTYAYLAYAEECIGCGLCEKACPVEAIKLVKQGERPYFVSNNIGGIKEMISKIYCKIFQAVMKIANYFLGYRMPEYISGPGSIEKLPGLMKAKGANNALVVTDSNLVKLGIMDPMLKALDDAGLNYSVFSDLAVNPTTKNVEEGYKVYVANNCECIVAFGGGAPMDCAKGIGAKTCHPKKTATDMQGLLKVGKKLPLFFAIPTTSGTGSETTLAAVITDDETHHKASINDPHIIPNYAILDPTLTKGLPPKVTSTTGMDALCHAVEAYTNKTYNTPLEDHLAKDAVRLIHNSLLKAYQDGSDLKAREDMQLAAFYAGRAFTRGCVGYVHACGHTLGGLYGVPHGLAMSVILPHVMRQFGPAVYSRLADLADVCCMDGNDDKEKALNFIAWMEDLNKQMDIPTGFDCIKEEDIPQIIKWANAESNPLYPTPVKWGKKDFEQLIASIRE